MSYYSNESAGFVYVNCKTYMYNKKIHFEISFPSNNLLFIWQTEEKKYMFTSIIQRP
jgi:hypothetical protein